MCDRSCLAEAFVKVPMSHLTVVERCLKKQSQYLFCGFAWSSLTQFNLIKSRRQSYKQWPLMASTRVRSRCRRTRLADQWGRTEVRMGSRWHRRSGRWTSWSGFRASCPQMLAKLTYFFEFYLLFNLKWVETNFRGWFDKLPPTQNYTNSRLYELRKLTSKIPLFIS